MSAKLTPFPATHIRVKYIRRGVTYVTVIPNGGPNAIELSLLAKKIGRSEVIGHERFSVPA